MVYKPTGKEIAEHMAIFHELVASYGIELPPPTREEAIASILKHRPGMLKARREARTIGKALSRRTDEDFLTVLNMDMSVLEAQQREVEDKRELRLKKEDQLIKEIEVLNATIERLKDVYPSPVAFCRKCAGTGQVYRGILFFRHLARCPGCQGEKRFQPWWVLPYSAPHCPECSTTVDPILLTSVKIIRFYTHYRKLECPKCDYKWATIRCDNLD